MGGVHRAPPGGAVLERLVNEFIEFVNSRAFKANHVVVQALVAHFYFVTLHPFGNGNGRTTHGFYSLSNYFYRNRDKYFRLLQETRSMYRYDLTAFMKFGIRGFIEELDRINSYVRNRTHRLHYRELIRRCCEKRVGRRRKLLNEREAELLHRILDISKPADPFSNEPARETRKADLAQLWKDLYRNRTNRTWVRELTRLSQLGFVEFTGEGDDIRVLVRFDAISRY